MKFNSIWALFSYDVGIDLGTVNTLVAVKGKGIVIREPSVVAVHKKTRQVLDIGAGAKKMLGRTPGIIEAVRPLRDGVISDFDTTEAMLRHFIQKVHQNPRQGLSLPKIPRPRVVIGIPSGVTEVERRAVQDAAVSAGAREAFLIEEPMAAAIGAGMKIEEPEGNFIVDIGGGTTEIAVISMGGIVLNRSLRVAGDELDQDIISYMRMRYGLLIGERTAEEVKIELGSALPAEGKEKEVIIRGRELATGLPKSIKVTSAEIREALSSTITQIINSIHEVLEETPPELLSDILERGIVITGGGSLIKGLDRRISDETKIPVIVADDPLTTVVRGCYKLLDNLDLLEQVKVTGGLS